MLSYPLYDPQLLPNPESSRSRIKTPPPPGPFIFVGGSSSSSSPPTDFGNDGIQDTLSPSTAEGTYGDTLSIPPVKPDTVHVPQQPKTQIDYDVSFGTPLPEPPKEAHKKAWKEVSAWRTDKNVLSETDIGAECEFPRLPFAQPVFFSEDKSSFIVTSPRDSITTDRTILRFSNRHEVSEMYQQLVDLKGWSEKEERDNWSLGFIQSKRAFVESQLPALRKMGFNKIPTKKELKAFTSTFRKANARNSARTYDQLRRYEIDY
ncbi:hypothetical protein BJ508DRAFT_366407 [Ascobolus immersus RN42]|uniref:Uncharacterized protein n=1 Tax=Ascobolus immersus RN42 TaxID=1160509 RepID=A0A3N4HPU4_ASCIM|nr:hypothetical protein BJ508DRAFT_366407 [Ascobolus immersus RN42]